MKDQMVDIIEARKLLGFAWGLERPLTRVELARALHMSPEHGGQYLGRIEKKGPVEGGAMQTALELMLDGAKPRNMEDLITPGYPKGPVR